MDKASLIAVVGCMALLMFDGVYLLILRWRLRRAEHRQAEVKTNEV